MIKDMKLGPGNNVEFRDKKRRMYGLKSLDKERTFRKKHTDTYFNKGDAEIAKKKKLAEGYIVLKSLTKYGTISITYGIPHDE